MGTIGNQMSQVFLSRYGVELDSPQDRPLNSVSESSQDANSDAGAAVVKQQPPRAAQTELNRLMQNFARETYSTTAVNQLLAPQKDNSPSLAKNHKKDLQKLADLAADALAKIKDITVKDILDDQGETLAELFEKAADLQLQLGNKLRELSASKKYRKDKFCEFREMLDDISFKCDSRGSEIMTLYCEVKEFAERRSRNEVGDNAAFHQAKVGDLVKGMAGSMHGNDKSLLFKNKIDSIETRLAQFSTSTVVTPDDLQQLLSETASLSAELKKPNVAQTMDADIHKALTSHLSNLWANLNACVDDAVQTAANNLMKPQVNDDQNRKAKEVVQELYKRNSSWGLDRANKLSGEDIVNVFRGKVSLSMALEARVHGANESDINPQLCDRNLVKKEELGSGAANTVYKMTYKMSDGSEKDYVFKPDLSGRVGLESLSCAGGAYSNTQQSVKLNTATCSVAEFLGLGRLTGKNYVTVNEGQYGLLMEMAPGSGGEKVNEDDSVDNRKRFASLSVVGKLAKEFNELRWLDIATGQGDRHYENYLVDFGKDGKTPKVTAIDNDASFGSYLVGVGKFKIDYNVNLLDEFKRQLKRYCRKTHADFNAIMEKIGKNGYVIDMNNAGKEEISALRMTLGFQSFSQPQQMSRSLCDKLKSLTEEQIEEFAETLVQNIDKRESILATVQRLKDMKQIAIEYEQAGKVVDDDKWETSSVVKKEMECPSLIKNEDRHSDPNYIVDYQLSSTLARDFGGLIPSQWK